MKTILVFFGVFGNFLLTHARVKFEWGVSVFS